MKISICSIISKEIIIVPGFLLTFYLNFISVIWNNTAMFHDNVFVDVFLFSSKIIRNLIKGKFEESYNITNLPLYLNMSRSNR